MDAIENTIKKIMPVLTANNKPENIEYYLKGQLTKLYDEAFYQGTINVLGKGYNETIRVITEIIGDKKINKADRIYDYMTKEQL